jgi:hypothetical protein
MEEIQRGEPPLRVLKPGRNCWKVASADRAAVLIDGQSYFGRLEQALLAARRSILILGWDFDASIKLRGNADEHCPAVGDFLRSLVEGRPELSIRILVWNAARRTFRYHLRRTVISRIGKSMRGNEARPTFQYHLERVALLKVDQSVPR